MWRQTYSFASGRFILMQVIDRQQGIKEIVSLRPILLPRTGRHQSTNCILSAVLLAANQKGTKRSSRTVHSPETVIQDCDFFSLVSKHPIQIGHHSFPNVQKLLFLCLELFRPWLHSRLRMPLDWKCSAQSSGSPRCFGSSAFKVTTMSTLIAGSRFLISVADFTDPSTKRMSGPS